MDRALSLPASHRVHHTAHQDSLLASMFSRYACTNRPHHDLHLNTYPTTIPMYEVIYTQIKPGQPALTQGSRYDGKSLSLVYQPKFLPSRDFTVRVKVAPGNYVLMPCTYNRDEEANFLLRLYAEKKPKTTLVCFLLIFIYNRKVNFVCFVLYLNYVALNDGISSTYFNLEIHALLNLFLGQWWAQRSSPRY